MTLTMDQVKEANRQRIEESSRDKAETFTAQKEAEAENGWTEFLMRHSGQRGISDKSLFLPCEANTRLLEEWIVARGLTVNLFTLEQSFQENRHRLANHIPDPYERRSNTQESRVFPQIKALVPIVPPIRLPFTRNQILQWSKQELKKQMGKSPAHVAEINRILAER